jgi:hypothetical protein
MLLQVRLHNAKDEPVGSKFVLPLFDDLSQ